MDFVFMLDVSPMLRMLDVDLGRVDYSDMNMNM